MELILILNSSWLYCLHLLSFACFGLLWLLWLLALSVPLLLRFILVFDPVYMVFDALHGVYMVKGGVAQLDPRLAGEKNSPPCRPIYLHVEYFTWS